MLSLLLLPIILATVVAMTRRERSIAVVVSLALGWCVSGLLAYSLWLIRDAVIL